MLKTSFNILTFCALVTAAVLAGAQEVPEGSPQMVIPEKIKDVGQVAQGEKIEISFKIMNEGSGILKINAVRPTCGCTVAEFDRTIAPGASGAVKATLDTRDFTGPISKSILVMTSDPTTSAVNLIIKANVRPYVEILPRPLLTMNALQKEGASEKVVVIPVEGVSNFKITKVEHSPELFDVTVRKLEGNELINGRGPEQFEVTVTLADEAPLGPIQEELILHTNNEKAKTVHVKIFGVVRSALQVSPPQLQFGSVDAAAGPGRYVIVSNNRIGSALDISTAAVNDEAFNAEVVTVEAGRRYQVMVTVNKDATPGARDVRLTLTTSDQDHAEISIPIRANIR